MRSLILVLVLLVGASASAFAQTKTTFVVTPQSTVFGSGEAGGGGGNHVVGVPMDAAPGFEHGSLRQDGLKKTDMYFSPEMLFGRQVLLREVKSVSFWLKKGLTHAIEMRDFYLLVYNKRFSGQVGSSFYGTRLLAMPGYASGLYDPPNEWSKYSSRGTENRLGFVETTYPSSPSFTDPDLQTLQTRTSATGLRGPGLPFASQPILYFSLQTGSGSESAGFMGQIDGLHIVLNDRSEAKVNFEPFLVPSDKEQCKGDGLVFLHRPDGSKFKNRGDCVSFTSNGK